MNRGYAAAYEQLESLRANCYQQQQQHYPPSVCNTEQQLHQNQQQPQHLMNYGADPTAAATAAAIHRHRHQHQRHYPSQSPLQQQQQQRISPLNNNTKNTNGNSNNNHHPLYPGTSTYSSMLIHPSSSSQQQQHQQQSWSHPLPSHQSQIRAAQARMELQQLYLQQQQQQQQKHQSPYAAMSQQQHHPKEPQDPYAQHEQQYEQHELFLEDYFSNNTESQQLSNNNNNFGLPVVSAPVSSTTLPLPRLDTRPLEHVRMACSSLSVTPLSGTDIFHRMQDRCRDVTTRYVVCADFLVACQQDLRRAASAMAGRHPKQHFIAAHVGPLPAKFQRDNQHRMDATSLNKAVEHLRVLTQDAAAQSGGVEAIRNQFLGGMRDGESWGLRKWLSQHGNALAICTDIECVVQAMRSKENSDNIQLLSDVLRPLAQQTLRALKESVPQSYQEHSSAHPYLPFFHRLEGALRSMSLFDPKDDVVICIDDSSDEDENDDEAIPATVRSLNATTPLPKQPTVPATTTPSKKRKAASLKVVTLQDEDRNSTLQEQQDSVWQMFALQTTTTTAHSKRSSLASSSGESDDESVIEIVDSITSPSPPNKNATIPVATKWWSCALCQTNNMPSLDSCINCGEVNMMDDLHVLLGDGAVFQVDDNDDTTEPTPLWPIPPPDANSLAQTATTLSNQLDRLAQHFDRGEQSRIRPITAPFGTFWDGPRYASALRLFASLMRMRNAASFVERIRDDASSPPVFSVIKHPLCFRDICESLLFCDDDINYETPMIVGNHGRLPAKGLQMWNMWKGADLLMAVDLVLLNSLAYGRVVAEGKTEHRSNTNKLRKYLWEAINRMIEPRMTDSKHRRSCVPTRRSEASGFVVYKLHER
jgi:hypothetical protein